MRLAWFTPWPPDRSGVAGRSAELVPLLAAEGFGIDVFVDERRRALSGSISSDPAVVGVVRVFGAHEFVWRHARAPYDLTIYQVGNSEWHEFLWPYLFRWPGLAVLHDARVHHARGRSLLSTGRIDAYRTEFAWSHPHVAPEAAEFGVNGFNGPYYYQWPMIRGVVESARLVAAHSRGAVAEIESAHPDRPVEYVALGEGRTIDASEDTRSRFRSTLGFPASAVVFGVFGALTAEKRVPQVVRAFGSALARNPEARLVLAGAADPQIEIAELVEELGLAPAVRLLTLADDAAFDEALASVDVTFNLRWPTTLETSGPWLRAIAAGRATVLMDAAHLTQLATLDPRTWRLHEPRASAGAGDAALAVGIDVLDEDHSLRLACARLAADADLRRQLGDRARAYWEAEHTVVRMVDDYTRAIARAVSTPAPVVALPAHLRPDPLRHARALWTSVLGSDLALQHHVAMQDLTP
jgi:glycosyltransferase involved in cell wall biosynthesis